MRMKAEEEEDYEDDEEDQAEVEFVGRMWNGWIMILSICQK